MPSCADTLILRVVRALSNFLKRADPPSVEWRCRAARAEEIESSLRLILSHAGGLADHSQVVDFIAFAAERHIDVREIWLAEAEGRIGWAVLPILSPGRTMLLFVPPVGDHEPAAGQLINTVCDHFGKLAIHLAQALLDPGDEEARELFLSRRFRQMAELIYLSVTIRRPPPAPPLPPGISWKEYSDPTHPLFARAIGESYENSLDCPGLNGLRDIQDVIAGHKATGEFDPAAWFVLTHYDEPLGAVLLSRIPRTDAVELVYLGLTPAARGRGLADLLMRQALWATARMKRSRLTLAVDSENAPALKLYYRHGMQKTGSKIALMRDLRRETAP